jgi:hypothetical protein
MPARTRSISRRTWGLLEGHLHRVTVSLARRRGQQSGIRDDGAYPDLAPEAIWDRPNFVGLNNFLSRIRFAIDPNENAFYFGV